MSTLNKKSGFTLVEVLIYLGIFLVVATSSVTFMVSLDDFVREYKVETALYRSGTSILEQVQLALREGETFNASSSVLYDPAGVLSISASGTSTTFSQVGGELLLDINSVLKGNLATDPVTVTDFTVYEYDMALGQMVRVRLGLSATIGSTTKSVTLYTGSLIRDSL